MNVKISVFVICVKALIYLLLYNGMTVPLTHFKQMFQGFSVFSGDVTEINGIMARIYLKMSMTNIHLSITFFGINEVYNSE